MICIILFMPLNEGAYLCDCISVVVLNAPRFLALAAKLSLSKCLAFVVSFFSSYIYIYCEC